jgi:hypothetical protein
MIKSIAQDFKEYYFVFKDWVYFKRHALKLKVAMKFADIKQAAFNKQFFVILAGNGKLVAVNNDDVKRLKQAKMLDKRMDGLTLRRMSFYYTSNSKNNTMSAEQLADAKDRYFKYAKKYLK